MKEVTSRLARIGIKIVLPFLGILGFSTAVVVVFNSLVGRDLGEDLGLVLALAGAIAVFIGGYGASDLPNRKVLHGGRGRPPTAVLYHTTFKPVYSDMRSTSETYYESSMALVVAGALVMLVGFSSTIDGSPNLEIVDWGHVNIRDSTFFIVKVVNTGDGRGSAVIVCAVTFDNGDTYSGWKDVTLAAGKSADVGVMVFFSYSHLDDLSGQYDCKLSYKIPT